MKCSDTDTYFNIFKYIKTKCKISEENWKWTKEPNGSSRIEKYNNRKYLEFDGLNLDR